MNIPVIILCGGLASRLGDLTRATPKSLVEVKGRPFIDWQLEQLKKQGIVEIILCVGHLQDQIISHVGDGKKYGLEISYSSDKDLQLGTGGALKGAMEQVSNDFIVTYGDSFLPTNFQKISEFYFANNRAPLVAVCKQQYSWEKPNVRWLNDRKIIYDKFDEKTSMDYIDYGISILNKNLLSEYTVNIPFDLANLFNELSVSGNLFGININDPYFEVGSVKGINSFNSFLEKR